MKKLFGWLAVFFISFFVTLLFLLPYKNIYGNLINKYAQSAHIKTDYNITHASLFSLNADKILINKGENILHFDKLEAKIYPINYLIGGDLLELRLVSASDIADIGVKLKNNSWLIQIKTPASMFENSIKNFKLPFKMKGDILAEVKIKNENKQIIIQNISVSGPINIDAQGYLKNNHLSLNGKIKFGSIKQKFNFDQNL